MLNAKRAREKRDNVRWAALSLNQEIKRDCAHPRLDIAG